MNWIHKGALMLCVALPGVGVAQSGAASDTTLREGFYAFRMADTLRLNCPSISFRLVRGHQLWTSLYDHGASQGYARADIDAVRDSLEPDVQADLAARGATPGATTGYCRIGRQEMGLNTAAGRLLKAD